MQLENPNKAALAWWRALSTQEQVGIAKMNKPDWTFDMFTRSTHAIRLAHQEKQNA